MSGIIKMVDAALVYLRHGYSVIPVKPDKKPFIKWQKYQSELPSEQDVVGWWALHPDANIGIITGEISNLCVVDADSALGLQAVKSIIDEEPNVETPNGGWHWYFGARNGFGNATRFLADTDFRGDGGYVLVPPSIGANGKPYLRIGDPINESRKTLLPYSIASFFKDLSGNHSSYIESLNDRAWEEGSKLALKKNARARVIKDETFDHKVTTEKGHLTTFDHKNMSAWPQVTQVTHLTTGDTFDHKTRLFTEGRRDEDLFHLANSLVKGGMPPKEIAAFLHMVGRNLCDPPFPEKEIPIKIQSAIKRSQDRNRNFSQEVKEWVLTTQGNFQTADVYRDLNLIDRTQKKACTTALLRLAEEGLIEKYGEKKGAYRTIENNIEFMKFLEDDFPEYPVKLPFGLNSICSLYPKNMVIVAGSKSSGKTALLLDIATRNQDMKDVIYLNSEMGNHEWTVRLKKMGFSKPGEIKFKGIKAHHNFHDMVDGRDAIFIVDFMEIHDSFYEIAKPLRLIHEKLDEGICIVSIQKKKGERLGRGAEFSMEKARLYLSMEFVELDLNTLLTIIDAKAPKTPMSAAGLSKRIKIIDGSYMEAIDKEWRRN